MLVQSGPSSEAGHEGGCAVAGRSVVLVVALAVLHHAERVAATLTPAPGTGHGVIGNTTPAEEGVARLLARLGCRVSRKAGSNDRVAAALRVGLPRERGRRPAGERVHRTVSEEGDPGDDHAAARPHDHASRPGHPGGAPGVSFDMLVSPSPPSTRYRSPTSTGSRGKVASLATAAAPIPCARGEVPRRRRRRSCSTRRPRRG